MARGALAAAALAAAALADASAAARWQSRAGGCPDMASLRSPAVLANWSAPRAAGLFYENRYTDFAQIGASCQRMNKTALADGSIDEVR